MWLVVVIKFHFYLYIKVYFSQKVLVDTRIYDLTNKLNVKVLF